MNGTLRASLQVFWVIGAAITYIVQVVGRWQESASAAQTITMNFTVDLVTAIAWPVTVPARLIIGA